MFNTVITRAKSLIVSVGNPYLLLAIEKHMIDKYGDIGRCWSKYILKCIQHDTLIVPDSVIMSPTKKRAYTTKLYKIIEERLFMKSSTHSGAYVNYCAYASHTCVFAALPDVLAMFINTVAMYVCMLSSNTNYM